MEFRCGLYLHRFRAVADVDVIQTADRVSRLVNIRTVPPHLDLWRRPWKYAEFHNHMTSFFSPNFSLKVSHGQLSCCVCVFSYML